MITPIAPAKKISISLAEKQGFVVDTHCYPHIGYKGDRFAPTELVHVHTKLESELLHFKHSTIGLWCTDRPELLTDEEKKRCYLFHLEC